MLLSSSGCAWLDVRQRQIIYRPTPGVPSDFAGLSAGDERYFSTLPREAKPACASQDENHRIELWWLPHADKSAPTLLYFHGTFRNLFQNLRKIEALRSAGFAVLAVDYRGWGLSTAIVPSERTILCDAEQAWTELRRREPRPAQRVLYGHSMGSAVAVDLASRLHGRSDYGALILESAFTSFTELASDAGLLPRLLIGLTQERFASLDKMAQIQAPLLMLHGSADRTVPPHLGEKLFAAAHPPKQWRIIEGGGHSDLDLVNPADYQTLLRAFTQQYLDPPRDQN